MKEYAGEDVNRWYFYRQHKQTSELQHQFWCGDTGASEQWRWTDVTSVVKCVCFLINIILVSMFWKPNARPFPHAKNRNSEVCMLDIRDLSVFLKGWVSFSSSCLTRILPVKTPLTLPKELIYLGGIKKRRDC